MNSQLKKGDESRWCHLGTTVPLAHSKIKNKKQELNYFRLSTIIGIIYFLAFNLDLEMFKNVHPYHMTVAWPPSLWSICCL